MAKDDSVDGKIIDLGRRYTGATLGASEENSVPHLPQGSQTRPEVRRKSRDDPVDAKNIRWEGPPKRNVLQDTFVDCKRLAVRLEWLILNGSAYTPLYKVMLKGIRAEKNVTAKVPIRAIAEGRDSQRAKGSQLFYRVALLGREYELPQSFAWDFRHLLTRPQKPNRD